METIKVVQDKFNLLLKDGNIDDIEKYYSQYKLKISINTSLYFYSRHINNENGLEILKYLYNKKNDIFNEYSINRIFIFINNIKIIEWLFSLEQIKKMINQEKNFINDFFYDLVSNYYSNYNKVDDIIIYLINNYFDYIDTEIIYENFITFYIFKKNIIIEMILNKLNEKNKFKLIKSTFTEASKGDYIDIVRIIYKDYKENIIDGKLILDIFLSSCYKVKDFLIKLDITKNILIKQSYIKTKIINNILFHTNLLNCAKYNLINLFVWILSIDTEFNDNVYEYLSIAISNNSLDIIKFIIDNYKDLINKEDAQELFGICIYNNNYELADNFISIYGKNNIITKKYIEDLKLFFRNNENALNYIKNI